jgi:hypothetical protein
MRDLGAKVTRIVSSPFRRCLQTAAIVAKAFPAVLAIEVDVRLAEAPSAVRRICAKRGVPFESVGLLSEAEVGRILRLSDCNELGLVSFALHSSVKMTRCSHERPFPSVLWHERARRGMRPHVPAHPMVTAVAQRVRNLDLDQFAGIISCRRQVLSKRSGIESLNLRVVGWNDARPRRASVALVWCGTRGLPRRTAADTVPSLC